MRVPARTPIDEAVQGSAGCPCERCGDCSHFVAISGPQTCDGWCSAWRILPRGRSLLVRSNSAACPLHRVAEGAPMGRRTQAK